MDKPFDVWLHHDIYDRAMKDAITITDDATSENIEQIFHEYFNDIELLPRKLEVQNTELWPVCCTIYQVSIFIHVYNSNWYII